MIRLRSEKQRESHHYGGSSRTTATRVLAGSYARIRSRLWPRSNLNLPLRHRFLVSSLYCHACGASRPDLNSAHTLEVPGLAELVSLGERLGLTTPAVVSFLLGVFCVVGALGVSVFFSARTVLDWQAIQLWRIEWLLGAVAAFVAGCLLKK